ncbi:MAG: hypothetical protein KGO47_07245 [Cyanobacteria bacterium REEB417]|nr:hypothetical protein [Cyanobacteria bacterium REEB417]
MSTFNQPVPTRITITVPFQVFSALRDRADREGRSTSNLGAFLLEQGLAALTKKAGTGPAQ